MKKIPLNNKIYDDFAWVQKVLSNPANTYQHSLALHKLIVAFRENHWGQYAGLQFRDQDRVRMDLGRKLYDDLRTQYRHIDWAANVKGYQLYLRRQKLQRILDATRI